MSLTRFAIYNFFSHAPKLKRDHDLLKRQMTTIKIMVQNRRINIPAPSDIPDGTEVTLTISESGDAPLPAEEFTRLLAAMHKLDPWSIPAEVAADLDDWERKMNQHGIEDCGSRAEDVSPC